MQRTRSLESVKRSADYMKMRFGAVLLGIRQPPGPGGGGHQGDDRRHDLLHVEPGQAMRRGSPFSSRATARPVRAPCRARCPRAARRSRCSSSRVRQAVTSTSSYASSQPRILRNRACRAGRWRISVADPPGVGGEPLDGRSRSDAAAQGLGQAQRPADPARAGAVGAPVGQHPQHQQDGDDHAHLDQQVRVHHDPKWLRLSTRPFGASRPLTTQRGGELQLALRRLVPALWGVLVAVQVALHGDRRVVRGEGQQSVDRQGRRRHLCGSATRRP